jgi:Rne/Rng family ribonuclease
MKGRVILIDMPKERASQAALLVDGRIEDLLLDPLKGDTTPAPGEIYWAKVDRLVPKMGGAFVKLTPSHQGFLRNATGLKEGAGILAQISSYPELGKAFPVTTRLLYKGHRIIHTPDAPGINVSRQIKDSDERARLTKIVATWTPDADRLREPAMSYYRQMHDAGGFIIRSAAKDAEADELHTEISWILASRSEREGLARGHEPGTTSGASWVIDEAIREWVTDETDVIALSKVAAQIFLDAEMIERRANRRLEAVVHVHKLGDLFDHYGVWDEIEKLKSPRTNLPSGAWMAVEATRAMVTVDVNTGGEFGGGSALTANLEAAKELPRQLRLRGLGGQVIIDFAPLKKTDRKRIEEALKAAFRKDPIDTTLAGWTPLGNFELQRKRERRPLSELLP